MGNLFKAWRQFTRTAFRSAIPNLEFVNISYNIKTIIILYEKNQMLNKFMFKNLNDVDIQC